MIVPLLKRLNIGIKRPTLAILTAIMKHQYFEMEPGS